MSLTTNHNETNDSQYKHTNATAELIVHLTTSTKASLDDGITRRGSEMLLNPSNLEETTIKDRASLNLSKNIKCFEEKVKTLDACEAEVVPSTHVKTKDDPVSKRGDSVYKTINEKQEHKTEQAKDSTIDTFDAKLVRDNLETKTKGTSASEMTHIKVAKQTNLYAKLDDDKYACKIVGMSTTKMGLVLLADLNNNKLKVFSTTNIPLSAVGIPRGPLSVALVGDTCALVSRHDKNIGVIDISNAKSIKVTDTIKLDYKIMGITACCGNIVVTTLTVPRGVKMLKWNGDEVWSVTMDLQGKQMFEAPENIVSFVVENETVAVSDYRKETLTFISGENGDILKTIDIQGTGPEGITVDNYNNLFVACFDRNEVWYISENGRKFQTVLSGSGWSKKFLDTISRIRSINCRECPHALAYNRFTKEIFVSYNPSDFVDRFTLTRD